MDRVTLRIPKQQIEELENQVDEGRFPNRSEAIRAAVRRMLDDATDQQGSPYNPQNHSFEARTHSR